MKNNVIAFPARPRPTPVESYARMTLALWFVTGAVMASWWIR